eukprot:3035190-Pleurochrysis_carterae.AAC.2
MPAEATRTGRSVDERYAPADAGRTRLGCTSLGAPAVHSSNNTSSEPSKRFASTVLPHSSRAISMALVLLPAMANASASALSSHLAALALPATRSSDNSPRISPGPGRLTRRRRRCGAPRRDSCSIERPKADRLGPNALV